MYKMANMQTCLKQYAGYFTFFLLLLFNADFSHCSQVSASASLKSTLDEVLAILRDDEFKVPERKMERRNILLCVLEYRFDFEEMAKRSLAKEWKKRSKNESYLVFVPIFICEPELLYYKGNSLEEDVFPILAKKRLLNGYVSTEPDYHIHTKKDIIKANKNPKIK